MRFLFAWASQSSSARFVQLKKGPKHREVSQKRLAEMLSDEKPDLLIAYTSYSLWPDLIKHVRCPKIMVETDFYKKIRRKQLSFYRECRFELVIQRGAFDPSINIGIPQVWLPFSADPVEFFSNPLSERLHLVGFAGSRSEPVYAQRRLALQKLAAHDLLVLKEKRVPGYPRFVRSVLGWLHSAELNSPYGKFFEAMASGTVLLTPKFRGYSSIMDGHNCCVHFKKDCSDIVDRAKWILEDHARAEAMAAEARRIFLKHHTHSARVKELDVHITNLLSGKKPKHFWSLED